MESLHGHAVKAIFLNQDSTFRDYRLFLWGGGGGGLLLGIRGGNVQSINQALFTHGIPSLQMLFQRAVP